MTSTSLLLQAQQHFILRGYVYTPDNQAIPGAYIRVQNTSLGTTTNSKGQYEIRLQKGLNRIIYSCMGFKSQQIDVVITSDLVQNIWLEEDEIQLEGVSVNARKRDYSYEVMKQVIEHKKYYRDQYHSIKQKVYIKSTEEIKRQSDDTDLELTTYLDESDSIPNLNMFEGEYIQHFSKPNNYKQEKLAAEKRGTQRSLFYTSPTEGNFDFYDNMLTFRGIGDNTYVSPFSPATFISYKFKLLGSYFEGNHKVYKIKVIPRKLGNALLKGEIEVYDQIWALKSVRFSFPPYSLIAYDRFSVQQRYTFIDSIWVISEQSFEWKIKASKTQWKGITIVKHSEFVFDTLYPKRFFGAELGFAAEDAYDKDTAYWKSIRPVPLTRDEQVFVRYKDSIYLLKNSKVYLDSMDSTFNQITWQKLTYRGFGYINREKKVNWYFDPALGLLDPLAIGGWRVKYSFSYFKRYENRKSLYLSPLLNYGFRNKDVKGNFSFSYLYDPIKRSRIRGNIGRHFGFVNNFATIADIIRRDNFYVQNYIYLSHRTELFNGFYLSLGTDFTLREDLGDFEFAPAGDSLFENNDPLLFPTTSRFVTRLGISYTPKQLYLREPKEKIILGSRYPTFSLTYSRAWDNVLNANSAFDYGEFGINQLFNVGILGTSEYRINLGKFFDTANLSVVDYRYQRGGDRYWFTPAMFTFQLIDSTFATFDLFVEAHYVHQFNGFLTGRIPGFKQLRIKTMAGGGFLYAPEHNYQYSELFFGVNRIFKIGRERVRLGTYYVIAQSNNFGLKNALKFSFEFYNADRNTWSF